MHSIPGLLKRFPNTGSGAHNVKIVNLEDYFLFLGKLFYHFSGYFGGGLDFFDS